MLNTENASSVENTWSPLFIFYMFSVCWSWWLHHHPTSSSVRCSVTAPCGPTRCHSALSRRGVWVVLEAIVSARLKICADLVKSILLLTQTHFDRRWPPCARFIICSSFDEMCLFQFQNKALPMRCLFPNLTVFVQEEKAFSQMSISILCYNHL